MVTKVYGTTVIPSDQITVTSGSTVQVSVAFARTAGIIGGYDADNGSATAGQVVDVPTAGDAADLFGEGSELHEQSRLALLNGVQELKAVAVEETQTTESFSAVSGSALSNDGVFDPNVQPEETITETAVGADVNIVYDSPPQTPSGTDEINLNPVTGEWEADASDSYDIQYSYGDYTSAIDAMVTETPRVVVLCSEEETVVTDLATDLETKAQDFNFMHGVAGAAPVPDPSSSGTYTSTYTDGVDNVRMTLVSPARGFRETTKDTEVRTVGAVGGRFASLPLGVSATMKNASGINALRADYTNSEAAELIDNQVAPLVGFDATKIVKDMTTSTDSRFERYYTVQVVDEVTELSHQTSQQFIGEQKTADNLDSLRESHDTFLVEMRDDAVPLLDAFTLNVGEDSTGATIEIGIDVVGVIDTIRTSILVGDVVQNGGTA